MRNIFLLSICSFLFMVFSLHAQITITTNDAPSIGTIKLESHDSLPSRINSIQPGNPGTNQVWDFSTLYELYVDTTVFISPAATPYASSFPNSNLAVPGRMNGMPSYTYLKKDASGVYALGMVANINAMLNGMITVPLTPQSSVLRTPSSYQSTYSENYTMRIKTAADIGTYGDSIKMHSWVAQTSIIDGWGSITTPSGTFNVLRQKNTAINTDTAWIHTFGVPPIVPPSWMQYQTGKDTTITYRFWANGIGIPILEMERDAHTNAQTKKLSWYKTQNITGFAINGNLIYNNTANTILTGITANLYSGTTQIATTLTDASGNFTFQNIPNGTYTVNFTTSKAWGGVTSTDALKMKRHIAGLELLTEPIRLSAADPNNTVSITSTDVLKVQRRIAGLDASFTRPDWIFEIRTTGGNSVTINNANISANFYGICTGDVNGSNLPAK